MRKFVYAGLCLTVFALLNYGIYQKEQIKAHGETVYLELAPVDPRSLIQGDYMSLGYAVERAISYEVASQHDRNGYLVIAPDDRKVASFVRFYAGEALQPNERLLHYHTHWGRVRVNANSFMFQEGQAEAYQKAKYGQFKFSGATDLLLVDLMDEQFHSLSAAAQPH